MQEDAIPLQNCLRQIEAQLQWGDSRHWGNYDFEKLSTLIETRTGVVLSVTTLKRIWGKVHYPHTPSLTTLNVLARYLGFADWRAFGQSQIEPPEMLIGNTPVTPPRVLKRRFNTFLLLAILLVLVATAFAFFGKKAVPQLPKIELGQYQFKADKIVAEGVPNSVIFTYDASAAPTDSVYILQTWDARRKTLVPKDRHEHSAIYYYPGYFRTKLLVDTTVVRTHDLQINTDGWLALVENEPQPVYFQKAEYLKNGQVTIDAATLRAYNLPLLPVPPKVRFFNQTDLGDLMNDNFTFETSLKTDFNQGANACQRVEIVIQCKDDAFLIPLSARACAGDLRLYAAGLREDSRHADLSGFGCDLHQWTTLKVVAQNKHLQFLVNGKPAWSATFSHPASGIVGLQYRFNGPAAVRSAWFEENGRRVEMK